MPEFLTLRLVDAAYSAIIALLAYTWKTQERAFNDKLKQLKDDHDSRFHVVDQQIGRQRDQHDKIIDKLEEHARRSEERHLELLRAMHEGLSRKADK